LLSGLAAVSVGAIVPSIRVLPDRCPDFTLNPDRLRESLEGLSALRRPSGGSFADRRAAVVAFPDAIVGGPKLCHCNSCVDLDTVRASILWGNHFCIKNLLRRSLEANPFRFAIDSVLSGGNFDGDLGSMSAIEVVHTLKERGVTTGILAGVSGRMRKKYLCRQQRRRRSVQPATSTA